MTKHFLLRVKEGKLQQWKDWCCFLIDHKDQVRDTLRHENAAAEWGVLFEFEGQHYVYGATKYFGTPIKADSASELNQNHVKQVQDCLEKLASGQELFNIELDPSNQSLSTEDEC